MQSSNTVVAVDRFDTFVQRADGLPGITKTRPATVRDTHPLTGVTSTHIVQTYRDKDEGFTLLVERIDADGHYRIVLPPKVVQALYRQRQSLMDRSTPASRERKRRAGELKKKRDAVAARKAAWAARHTAND